MKDPSISHALAREEAQNYGVSPLGSNETAIIDLGWHKEPEHITELFVDGISNEDVWVLIRRFNKQVFIVKETDTDPIDGLDLGVAPDEDFSPNKMRAQLERMYMGLILDSLHILKHISRLRSWREPRRTAAFCAVYFLTWSLDLLTFATLALLITLIVVPKARRVLFPPAPLALVGSLSGAPTKPNAGVLGSIDSATGAPQNLPGETVENEASNFVTALGAIAMNVILGKDPQGEPNPEETELNAPIMAPNEMAKMVATAKDKAEGIDKPSRDKSKSPMETIMWSKMKPMMHLITMISDLWEKFLNAMNPKPPFHSDFHRRRLAAAIIPLAVASLFISREVVFRCSTFAVGLVIFGDPLVRPLYAWLHMYMSPFNTILKGVPTNSQLALTILRLGEARKTPIPPPPVKKQCPSGRVDLTEDIIDTVGDDQALGASDTELEFIANRDEDQLNEAGGEDAEATQEDSAEPKKIVKILKCAARLGVKTGVKADKARAKLGHAGAKNRVGITPPKNPNLVTGPVKFDARYKGQNGYLCLNTNAANPSLSFNRASSTQHAVGSTPDSKGMQPAWSIAINDIVELRKHSGYGFKSKLIAGWALDQELYDSLGVMNRKGEDFIVTAIPRRDQLFNRLIAAGNQTWETR